MGARKPLELLSPTERTVLQVLWDMGPQTVRQVWSHFLRERPDTAYTTVLTTLQELYAKRLVTRTPSKPRHVYQAVPRAEFLAAIFERQLAELGATAADRAHVVEVLRG
jgi:predicted transcriptional regulator